MNHLGSNLLEQTPRLVRAVRRVLGSVFLCGLCTGLSFAALSAESEAPKAPQTIYHYTLKNGMELIVLPDHRAPTAVHMVWVRVGSVDEVDGTSGVAHAIEHMMFKGTPKVGPGEFSRRVAALGGRENAFTNQDYTGFFQQIPANRLEAVMRLEADRFVNNKWPDAEFKKEIEVIKEERRMRTEDVPRSLLNEQLNAVQFTASAYRRPVIGWMNDLDEMTANDVRNFHSTWYKPNNAAVVVVGDVQPKQVLALANSIYGSIPVGQLPKRKPRLEPEQTGVRTLEVKAPAEQGLLVLSWKVVGYSADTALAQQRQDALALQMLSAVLDGYSGARLERAITQGDHPVADEVGAEYSFSGRGPQVFQLVAVPKKGQDLAQLESALKSQIQKVADEGVTAAELKRVKAQWIAGAVYKRDSLFFQAQELGTNWIEGFPLDASDQILKALAQVTPEQVKDVAKRYFVDDHLTVGHLNPLPVNKEDAKRAAQAAAMMRDGGLR
jgi:zinc protease